MKKSFLEKIENKVYWGIVGTLLTVAFGVMGLYTFFHVPKPNIAFEIISESNVLDVHKRLENLVIYFKNEDIQKKNLNLRIITIQISNNGEIDILQSFYDQKMKWGFEISDGKIINDARIVSSNSEYLKANLAPRVIDDNIVELEKTIFEKGKYFTVELLVLHKKDVLPKISYMGKIVGIDNVTPIKTWEKNLEPSFWTKFFYGSVLINLLRPIVDLVAFIGLIIIIAFSVDKLGDIKKSARRKKRVEEINNLFDGEPKDEKAKMLADLYTQHGLGALKQIDELLSDEKKLKKEIQRFKLETEYRDKLKLLEEGKPEAPPPHMEDMFISRKEGYMLTKFGPYWRRPQIKDLLEKKVVVINQQDMPVVDLEFRDVLSKMLLQFKNKGD